MRFTRISHLFYPFGASDEPTPVSSVPTAITGVVSDYPGEPDPFNALVEDL